MGLQVEHRRSTCSCGTLQGRRGTGRASASSPTAKLGSFFRESLFFSWNVFFWTVSGFGVWRPRSSETRWASSSCLTSQMNKVSSTSETGWVCPLMYRSKCELLVIKMMSCCFTYFMFEKFKCTGHLTILNCIQWMMTALCSYRVDTMLLSANVLPLILCSTLFYLMEIQDINYRLISFSKANV